MPKFYSLKFQWNIRKALYLNPRCETSSILGSTQNNTISVLKLSLNSGNYSFSENLFSHIYQKKRVDSIIYSLFYFLTSENALVPNIKTGMAIKPPIIPAKASLKVELRFGRK